jgi:hypothetical protein
MKLTRQNAKLASVFLTVLTLSITIPYQSIFAAMIGTEATLDSKQAQQARADINNLLLRADVQSALMAQGINSIPDIPLTSTLNRCWSAPLKSS